MPGSTPAAWRTPIRHQLAPTGELVGIDGPGSAVASAGRFCHANTRYENEHDSGSIMPLEGGAAVDTGPIRARATNPHYCCYHGKPIILITSAEHYGAVINKDFDYVAYFDALQAHGLNYARIYPGAMFEPVGKFMKGNTLGPKPGSLIVPWARSGTTGCQESGFASDSGESDPEHYL